jgi:hypothetical protein
VLTGGFYNFLQDLHENSGLALKLLSLGFSSPVRADFSGGRKSSGDDMRRFRNLDRMTRYQWFEADFLQQGVIQTIGSALGDELSVTEIRDGLSKRLAVPYLQVFLWFFEPSLFGSYIRTVKFDDIHC